VTTGGIGKFAMSSTLHELTESRRPLLQAWLLRQIKTPHNATPSERRAFWQGERRGILAGHAEDIKLQGWRPLPFCPLSQRLEGAARPWPERKAALLEVLAS